MSQYSAQAIGYCRLIVFSLGLVIFLVNEGRSQNTLRLQPSKDVYINTVIPDKFQGKCQSIIAAGWTYGGIPGIGRSLIGFQVCDLPPNFQLVKATLELKYDNSSGHAGHSHGLNSAKLFKITGAWNEHTTWNSKPTYDANLYCTMQSSTTTNQSYQVDVTGIVANCLQTSKEIGFYFKLDTEQYYRSLVFASRDHADSSLHPVLEIEYTADSLWCGGAIGNPNDSSSVPKDNSLNFWQVQPSLVCEQVVTIPNTFTPNEDGNNDVFKPILNCPVDEYRLQVYNRWGEVIFTTEDYRTGWNGEYGDSPVASGVYVYRISLGKASKPHYGRISLLR